MLFGVSVPAIIRGSTDIASTSRVSERRGTRGRERPELGPDEEVWVREWPSEAALMAVFRRRIMK